MRSLYTTLLILLLTVPAQALELTPQLQLKVADTFLAEGEYYRAVTEYKRFSILFPDSGLGDQAIYSEGQANFLGGQYKQAINLWQLYRERYPQSSQHVDSHFFEGVALWKEQDYTSADIKFDTVADFYEDSPFAPRALGAKVLMALDQEQIDSAKTHLEAMGNRHPGFKPATLSAAGEALDRYQKTPRKSKGLAATMSALLPGSGYFYAGRYGDGFSALTVNALFIYGAIESFDNDHNTAGYLIASFGLPFYLGNIYGSANAANKWNINVRKPIKDGIFASFDFVF